MKQLLTPYTLENITLQNRVVMPPMCMYKAKEDGKVCAFHMAHYEARAIGKVGLIIVEATAVEARGRITDNDLGLWNHKQIKGHKKLVSSCQEYGSKMFLQLAHAGRKSTCKHSTPIAPSALKFGELDGYKMPQELSLEEIKKVKNAFVKAAKKAKKAGYDGVELHGAHGYLLFEFLSPLTNQREDKYGGSLKNRCRLIKEIASKIISQVKIPLIVRISADEWVHGGWSLEDSIYLSNLLKKLGVSMIHVSGGGNHPVQPNMPELKPFYQSNYAAEIKHQVDIPTIAVGLITTASEGEELLAKGSCNLVAYGRELLRNPNFVAYVAREYEQRDFIDNSYLRAF